MPTDTANSLVTAHMGYARSLARNISKGLPPSVSFDDLEAAAYLGLTKAAQSFDSSINVLFTTYAYRFVRGAVFDALRKMTWMPPAVRARVVEQTNAGEVIDHAAEEISGSDDEEHLARQFSNMVARLGTVILLSNLPENDRPTEGPATTEEPSAPMMTAELRGRLRKAIEEMDPAQAVLVEMLYVRGLTMDAAGAELGVNKATVSRRHQALIEFLRARLAPPAPERGVPL